MTPDGHCKLLDFGALASFGSARLVVGTPPAIPPEALSGAPLDQRADLYSLGALAYWMLTARHAYPARQIEELARVWKTSCSPSALVEDIPRELDALVLSLLSADPLARPRAPPRSSPGSTSVAELTPEGGGRRRAPRGELPRQPPLRRARRAARGAASERTDALLAARGARCASRRSPAWAARACSRRWRRAPRWPGRASCASTRACTRSAHGTARALALRLLDALPQIARDAPRATGARSRRSGARSRRACRPRVDSRLPAAHPARSAPAPRSRRAHPSQRPDPRAGHRSRLVRRGERAQAAGPRGRQRRRRRRREPRPARRPRQGRADAPDPARRQRARTARARVSARPGHAARPSAPVRRSRCLSPAETLELVRSLFGNAPNVERFADWLHGRTAGSPLHCIEMLRQLVATRSSATSTASGRCPPIAPTPSCRRASRTHLVSRLAPRRRRRAASPSALSLQREQPTLALCRLLVARRRRPPGPRAARRARAKRRPLRRQDGYRFSSIALREALLGGMDGRRREENHRRLGEALAYLAGPERSPRCASRRAGTSSGAATEERGADIDRGGHPRQRTRPHA